MRCPFPSAEQFTDPRRKIVKNEHLSERVSLLISRARKKSICRYRWPNQTCSVNRPLHSVTIRRESHPIGFRWQIKKANDLAPKQRPDPNRASLQPGRVQGSFPEGGTSLHPLQPTPPRHRFPTCTFPSSSIKRETSPDLSSFEHSEIKRNPTKYIFQKRHLMTFLFLRGMRRSLLQVTLQKCTVRK